MTTPQKSAIPRKRELGESLGWIAGGSVLQPSKKKAIEGVATSSILELKAQLYKTQQEVKNKGGELEREFNQKKSLRTSKLDINKRNAGVEERDRRDREDLKVGTLLKSQLALERKAELYNKLVSGEAEDANQAYDVDFERKQYASKAATSASFGAGCSFEKSSDTDKAYADLHMKQTSKNYYNYNKHSSVKQLEKETESGREKAAMLKERRQDLFMQKRELLKNKYLKKLKATKRIDKNKIT